MDDSIFESGKGMGMDSAANIYKCANCCSTLLHDGSENEGMSKLKIKSNFSDEFSEIQIWHALEFIYGVSWTSIKNKLELKKRNPQEEITFCHRCATLLTENYNSHQNFEDSCHCSSLVKEFMPKRSGLTTERQNDTDSSHPQEEIDQDEKTALFDDFVFHETDDTIESQVFDSVETKYDPILPFSDNTMNLHTTSSIESEKLKASSRRKSPRSQSRHIKIEKELSDEKNFELGNENGNKSKQSSSRKVRTVKKYNGKSTFGSQKNFSKRKNKSDRKVNEVIPQQRSSRKTNNSKLFEDKVKKDIEQNTKKEKLKTLSKGRVCDDCGKSFSGSQSLYLHRVRNHRGVIYNCNVCGKVLRSRDGLRNHNIRKHSSEEEKNKWRTACKDCGANVFKFALSMHTAKYCGIIPRVKEKYTCDQCGMEYTSAQGFDDHLLTHSEEPKQCDVCSKVFLTAKRLLSHKNYAHVEKIKKFTCLKCPAAFVSEKRLRDHQYFHAESKKFVCEICGTSYKYPQHLSAHLRQHKEIQEKGVDAFTCDICNDGKRFAHSKSLKNHKQLKHGTKIFQCSYCGKQLSCGTNLRQHEALHKESPGFNPRAKMKERRSRNVLSDLPSTEEKSKLQTSEINN